MVAAADHRLSTTAKLRALALASLPYGAAEAAWLWLAWPLYQENASAVLGRRLQVAWRDAAIAMPMCYALLLAAVYVLVLDPLSDVASASPAIVWRCAFLGLACYGVYDLVSVIMLPGYSWTVAAIDAAWGAAAMALLGAVCWLVLQRWP
jgi:uncharacterized membrane protein